MQRIRFGLALDGERGWHVRDSLGDSTVGPLGLLGILETQLGLTRLAPSAAERIVQMRGCLAAAATGSRFYERSFKVDEFGTAATLLTWRDLWREHGWTGTVPPTASTRLTDMAAIDALAGSRVFPGMGERLTEVAAALTSRHPPIAEVELVDPLEDFPVTWQRVLTQLPLVNRAPPPPVSIAAHGTLLHSLQAALLGMRQGQPTEHLPWRDDGSVRLLRAATTLAGAEWLANHCCTTQPADCLWIVEHSGTTLDAALAAHDQPRLGASEASAFRPTLQLLPLVMRLLWEPLDFKALMQFLTHPVGPIPRAARRILAEKMADHPGLGGAAWDAALTKIGALDAPDGSNAVAEIQFWLEGERYRTGVAPLEIVQGRVARLERYFGSHLAQPDPIERAPWAAGHAQAAAAARSLDGLHSQGARSITTELLDRLIGEATAIGAANPLLRAEAAAHGLVRSPDAVIEPFSQVHWWHLAATPLAQPYPWSARELAQLRDIGVDLPPLGRVLERQTRGWERPILATRDCLTLLLPAAGEEVHPIWLTLASLLRAPVIRDVESVLAGDAVAGVTPVPHRPLPQRRRWFQIPANAIHRWDLAASFSSLDQFFNNPFQWALNYPAQLKPSAILDLPDDFRLYGNLGHRAVERLYREASALTWNDSQVSAWFEQTLDGLVREEGAVLLMTGRRADLESFRLRFGRSLLQLHAYLRSAGVIAVEPEKALEGSTPLGTLRGSIDLLLTLTNGRRAIIDMKWAGNRKYREKLETHTHVQLAIYARLVENNTSAWPAVAYFILREPELLTTADGVFPGTAPIQVAGASTATLWERVAATWRWRRAEIESGRLELVLEGLDRTDPPLGPPDALAVEPLRQDYNPCVHLAGWEGDA